MAIAELSCDTDALRNMHETIAREGFREEDCRVDIEALAGSADHLELASSPELWSGHYARRNTPDGKCWHTLSLPMSMFDLRGR